MTLTSNSLATSLFANFCSYDLNDAEVVKRIDDLHQEKCDACIGEDP